MRKICIVTGTRAEYGLLSGLMRLIKNSSECELQVIVTNMHLLPEFGSTYLDIEKDGFHIDAKVPMNKPSDDAYGIVASMSEEMAGMNDAFQQLSPDLVVILGDRYEMLVSAIVAMMHRIPIAHLYGGEISEGAIDDSIRHCITKMSNLHFTSTEEYSKRVIQLGENPERVFYAGSIGVENMGKVPLLSKKEISQSLEFEIGKDTILVTYHPVTLGERSAKDEINALLEALDSFPELKVVFTMPNSDLGCDEIRLAINYYCNNNPGRCKAFTSLGMKRYLSVIHYVAAVVGNSSSGLIEVPSAHIPTLNIGDRQKGRIHGNSVLDVVCDSQSIVKGLRQILSKEFIENSRKAFNPYERHGSTDLIFSVISSWPLYELDRKIFFDL